MSRPIIEVENLSKCYRLGQFNARTLREEVEQFLARFRNKRAGKGDNPRGASSEFWALKDVSFSVQPGEAVGIIGHNGAGKSTLLKILSRVTEPTSGTAYIRGRVASLLEVGTGFHPELTGRENIYLNGAILGMTKAEIKAKFDEIVDFSGVANFLDTPVKRYSSGMYVRLAFAVAAHLEPEILILDEVLAVGDAEFQKKCLGKIDDVSRRKGRTVIFVSHNMAAVKDLCSKGICLDRGQVQLVGDPSVVIGKYLSHARAGKEGLRALIGPVDDQKRRLVYFKSVSILDHEGRVTTSLDVTRPFHICIQYAVNGKAPGIRLVLRLETFDEIAVCSSSHSLTDEPVRDCQEHQQHTYYVEIPPMFLMPGSYFLTLAAHTPMVEVHDIHNQVLGFDILDTGTAFAMHNNYKDIGIVIADLPWRVTFDAR